MKSEARIFLADEKGMNQVSSVVQRLVLNIDHDRTLNTEPIGALLAFNDYVLYPQKRTTFTAERSIKIITIPLVGEVKISMQESDETIEAGEVHVCSLQANEGMTWNNPLLEEPISFLSIFLASNEELMTQKQNIPIQENANSLLQPIAKTDLYIGMFEGRTDVEHSFDLKEQDVFVYVIEGAFEVNNRLLHARDGLALWKTGSVEFEALSNNAMLLMFAV